MPSIECVRCIMGAENQLWLGTARASTGQLQQALNPSA